MATESGSPALLVAVRRWLEAFGAGSEAAGSSRVSRRGAIRLLLDVSLLGTLIGLALTDQTVVFFHLAFLGVLISVLYLPLRSFVLRALVIGPVASFMLVIAVQYRRVTDQELWEIPLTGLMLVVVYGLRWQREQAQRNMDETRFRVIAGVAHDIRNPLTSVLGFSELILEEGLALQPDELMEMVGVIARATSEANGIIDDLLTASRLEAKALDVTAAPVDVLALAESLVGHYRREDNEIPIRQLAAGSKLVCLADELRVRQILRNLLTNARRYGGAHVEVRLGRDESRVLVQVTDDGPGIPDHDGEHVFEAFTRSAGTSRAAESVGLGLYTSRRLARLMGGDLVYRYQDGASIFELQLPAGEAVAEVGESGLIVMRE